MENYEQKYKEALKWIHSIYPTLQGTEKEDAEHHFPELKESEDEKIRKEIIDFLRLPHPQFVGKRDHEEWISWLEKQGEQKPTDKIEPKFKVGDWILYSKDHCDGVRHITKIDENGYYIEKNGVPNGMIPFNHETFMRLWTIRDAKDGDVLYCVNSNTKTIYLFKEQRGSSNVATAYFQILNLNNELRLMFNKAADFNLNTCPATKEQRDLLFSKMKEEGYEWDAKKKQLRIEEVNGEDYGIDGLWHAQRILEKTLGSVDGYQSDDGILDHKAAITAVKKLYEQKLAEWSEEDKKMLDDIIEALTHHCYLNITDINWLKSLKDRVQPQQKQEWSEKDKHILKNIHDFVKENTIDSNRVNCAEECLNWLKSLKPQTHWKPSDEQMKALNALNNTAEISYIGQAALLIKLYNDLKKL